MNRNTVKTMLIFVLQYCRENMKIVILFNFRNRSITLSKLYGIKQAANVLTRIIDLQMKWTR